MPHLAKPQRSRDACLFSAHCIPSPALQRIPSKQLQNHEAWLQSRLATGRARTRVSGYSQTSRQGRPKVEREPGPPHTETEARPPPRGAPGSLSACEGAAFSDLRARCLAWSFHCPPAVPCGPTDRTCTPAHAPLSSRARWTQASARPLWLTQDPARCPAAAGTGPAEGLSPEGAPRLVCRPWRSDPPASGSHLFLPQSAPQSLSLWCQSWHKPCAPVGPQGLARGLLSGAELLQEASWLGSISTCSDSGNPWVPHLIHRGSMASAAGGVRGTHRETRPWGL